MKEHVIFGMLVILASLWIGSYFIELYKDDGMFPILPLTLTTITSMFIGLFIALDSDTPTGGAL